MSEIELIFIRHGEAANAWGAHKDPGLSPNGLKQAQSIIENTELQKLEKFDFISSPKARAIETSQPIANTFQKKVSRTLWAAVECTNRAGKMQFAQILQISI